MFQVPSSPRLQSIQMRGGARPSLDENLAGVVIPAPPAAAHAMTSEDCNEDLEASGVETNDSIGSLSRPNSAFQPAYRRRSKPMSSTNGTQYASPTYHPPVSFSKTHPNPKPPTTTEKPPVSKK